MQSQVIATLRGHEASVHSISLHSSGRFALAVSTRDSVLWDLDSFTRCRTLNGGQEVGVQDVSEDGDQGGRAGGGVSPMYCSTDTQGKQNTPFY